MMEYYGEELPFNDGRTKSAYYFFSAGRAFELKKIEEERKQHLTDLLDAYQKGKRKAVEAQMDEIGNQLAAKIFELGDKFHWGFGPGIEEHQPTLTELDILKRQREVLNELLPKYTGKTLDNVLVNIEARIKEEEK